MSARVSLARLTMTSLKKNRQTEFSDALPAGRHPFKNMLTQAGMLNSISYTQVGDNPFHQGRATWRHRSKGPSRWNAPDTSTLPA